MIAQKIARPINWILSALLLAAFAAQGYWLSSYFGKSEPIEVVGAHANPPVIHEGDPLIVAFKTIRRRLCQSDTDRIFMTESRVVVWRERVVGLSQPVTLQPLEISVRIILPRNGEFPPGNYIFRGVIYSNCGINDFHAIQQPDVHFKIIPRE